MDTLAEDDQSKRSPKTRSRGGSRAMQWARGARPQKKGREGRMSRDWELSDANSTDSDCGRRVGSNVRRPSFNKRSFVRRKKVHAHQDHAALGAAARGAKAVDDADQPRQPYRRFVAVSGHFEGFQMSQRLTYYVHKLLESKSGTSFFLLLLLFFLLTVAGIFLALVVPNGLDNESLFAHVHDDILEGLWVGWTIMADPGTHAEAPRDWPTRCVSFITTWAGILFFAFIIGFVVDAVQEKMEAIKKGRSSVVVSGHIVMLGWSEFSVAFIREVARANADDGVRGSIVVLASQDKQELELEFLKQIKTSELMGTEVVFRSGSPLHSSDLVKVACHTARAVLVLATPQGSDEGEADAQAADAATLRTVLSLAGMSSGLRGHIVAQVLDVDNEPLIRMVGGDVLEPIVTHDMVGRLMLVGARQPEVLRVFDTLLGFAGDEFYSESWTEIDGIQFGDIAQRMLSATPMGIKSARTGKIELNPAPSYVMQQGDKLIVLARDSHSYRPHAPIEVQAGQPPDFVPEVPKRETILVTGWRRDISGIFVLLDSVVAPGSVVHCLAEMPRDSRYESFRNAGFDARKLRNVKLVHHEGNSANRKTLEKLPISSFTSVMITADQANEQDAMRSDSHTLATLLLIRDIQRVLGVHEAGINVQLTEKQECGAMDEATQAAESLAAKLKMTSVTGRRESEPGEAQITTLQKATSRDSATPSRSKTLSRVSSWGPRKFGADGGPNRFSLRPTLVAPTACDSPASPVAKKRWRAGLLTRLTSTRFKAEKAAEQPLVPCICEILDSRTQREAIASHRTVATARDFIQSSRMISQILAMIAEDRDLNAIFSEFFSSRGAEFVVSDPSRLIHDGETISFLALAKRAQQLGETLCGYQTPSKTVLNPPAAFKREEQQWEGTSFVMLRTRQQGAGQSPKQANQALKLGMSHATYGDKGNPVVERELSRLKLEVANVNTKLDRVEKTLGRLLDKVHVDEHVPVVPTEKIARVHGVLTKTVSTSRQGRSTTAVANETVSL